MTRQLLKTYVRSVVDETQTAQLAVDFSNHLESGVTISLNATLGAGKTRFVQAVAQACGVPAGHVVSPTYVLCQEYMTDRFALHHLDVYRLGSEDEFIQLGCHEILAGESVKFIEWGDRVADCLPADRIDLSIEVTGATQRVFSFRGTGLQSQQIVSSLHGDANRLVYKIVPKVRWASSVDQGVFHVAPIDEEDGYVHFSAAHQVASTARKHFANQTDLLLLAIDVERLEASLRWEPARDDLFPHLYGALPMDAVVRVQPLHEGLANLART